jgi:hypothetical protein
MSYRPSCTDTSVGAAARPGDTTRDQAVRLLVNYFETIAKKAGMTWDPDYTAEISGAVDLIIEAALVEAQTNWAIGERVAKHERRLDQHEQQLKGKSDH